MINFAVIIILYFPILFIPFVMLERPAYLFKLRLKLGNTAYTNMTKEELIHWFKLFCAIVVIEVVTIYCILAIVHNS
jgi:hypothetical protein